MFRIPPPWRKPLGLALVAVIACIIASAFRQAVIDVLHRVSQVTPGFLLAGLALCVMYRVLNSSGWVFVLRSLRHPMPLCRGMRLWLLAESMRWVPGSIWGFCSRVYQAARDGVPAAVASASLPLELLLTIGSWCLVATGGLLVSGQSVDWKSLLSPRLLMLAGGGVVLVAMVIGVSVWKAPDGPIGRKILSLRADLGELRTLKVNPLSLLGVLLLYTLLGCLNGIAFFLVLRSVSDAPVSLLAVIGINAFGWLAGFLAVGAPGGIGVREAGAAFLLSALVPLPTAIAASVLWRLVMIVDEALCLSACLAPRLFGAIERARPAMSRVG